MESRGTDTFQLNQEYNQLMETMQISVSKHLLNPDFTVIWANDNFFRNIGYTRKEYEENFHNSCRELFSSSPAEFQKIEDAVKRALDNGEPGYELICRMPTKSGKPTWIRLAGTFARETIDDVPVLYTLYTDVNVLMETQEKLEQEHGKISFMLEMEKLTIDCIRILYESEYIREGIAPILEKVGRFLNADRAYMFEIQNHVMNNTFEWCADGVESQMDYCQQMDAALLDLWRRCFALGKSAVIADVDVLKTESPDAYKVLADQNIHRIILAPVIMGGEITGVVGVDDPSPQLMPYGSMLDTISFFFSLSLERNQLNEKILFNSYYDALTGLYNRNKYVKDIDKLAMDQEKPLGVVYVDINGLKDINDHMGHSYGDQVLMEAAQILTKIFRESRIYRIGGDEFVIFMEHGGEDKFQEYVEELRKCFFMSLDCKGAIGRIWLKDRSNLDKKIIEADEQMYQDKMYFYRKNPGSNRYRSYCDNALKLSDKQVLLRSIENGRFEVYLQPKVNFLRELIGGEALIRYHDDKGQLVMPNDFIPALEESRTICHVDFFVFETACRMLQRWSRGKYLLRPVSVNFSRYTLRKMDFIQRLEYIWEKYQVPKSLLEVEIIENDSESSDGSLLHIMEKIKHAGFSVSIDDFGARYSNMALFINAQLDTLKLDRSLMRDIVYNNRSQMLIDALSQICNNLDIQLIVEGVETEEQFQILKNLKCNGVQGYLISRPLTLTDYEEHYLQLT